MLLRRRREPDWKERLRVAVWPRHSWRRSFRYTALRLRRIPGSPHSIALGCAAGVFAIFTPFLGFQMLLAALLAYILGGSVIASAVGTFAGNPLTYPVIWVSTFTLGNVLVGSSASAQIGEFPDKAGALGKGLKDMSPEHIASALEGLWPILKPMALGSLPLGVIAAACVYYLTRRFIETKKQRRLQFAGLKAVNRHAR